MTNATSPVVTMCEPLAPNIITSADGRAYDLTALESPFGLLPEDVKEALRAWPHGRKIYHGSHWPDCVDEPAFCKEYTYRARPAPRVTEHVLYWCVGGWAGYHRTPGDTHKITIRHTGDTLPLGTYTGPDGATITVEKA